MDSPEGRGVARRRWFGFLAGLPRDFLDATGWLDSSNAETLRRIASPAQRREISSGAKEYSELIGFWVAWHVAGGFDQLEEAGWHRATIFRKIKRFRDTYGVHPDEYEFPWLTIDHDLVWHDTALAWAESNGDPKSEA